VRSKQARLLAMALRIACVWAALVCGGCKFDVGSAIGPPPTGSDDLALPDLAMNPPPPPPADLAQPMIGDDLAEIADLANPDLANPACTRIEEELRSDPSERWAFNGSARYDAAAKAIELNPALAIGSAGSAFFRTKLHMVAVDARFTFYMGDGTGADGLALVFAKAGRVDDLVPFGDGIMDDGYGIGYVGMNGFAMELDTHKNDNNGDPNDNHVGMMVTASGTHFLTGTPSGAKLRNGMVRKAHMRFDGKHVLVEIDDKKVIDADFPPNIIFNPDDYFIGFTASGGGLPDRHRVHSLSIVVGPPDVCF
jgi:hypothetical protein